MLFFFGSMYRFQTKIYQIAVGIFGLWITAGAWAQQDTVADSLARTVLEFAGGAEVWTSIPYVVFSQTSEISGVPNRIVRHVWNRKTNQYRMEIPGPARHPYVILFNTDTRKGKAYWRAEELESLDSSKKVAEAYQRFVNDTFWLFTPFFLFDSGVQRTFLPDSSRDSIQVLHLQFTQPDQAPAKEFYLYVYSGKIVQWKYQASQDAVFRRFEWRDYRDHPTPVGNLILSTRKRALGHPYEVVTRGIGFPAELPETWFTDGEAKLVPHPKAQ